MTGQDIDYEALAKQHGAIASIPKAKVAPGGELDYAALAKQHGAIGSTSTPAQPPTQPEGFWRSLSTQVAGLANMFAQGPVGMATVSPQAAAGIAGDFMNAAQNANQPISPETGLPIAEPSGMLKALHGTAALLAPVGGGVLEKGLEQFESRNYKGAAGTAVGGALPFALGSLMKPKAPLPAAEVLPKHIEALTGLIDDKAGTVDPHATASAALPILRETAVRMKVDPSRLEGREAGQTTLKVAEQAIKDTQNEFNEIRKPYNSALVDQKPIAQAYRDAITPELLANEPKVASALEKQAKKFDQPAPLEQVNQFRTRMNNQLNAFEQRGTTAQIMSDIETKASKAAANAAREVEYSTVGRLSGLDPEYVRGLKQREGTLIEAKNSLEKEYNRASGQQGEAASKGLREKVAATYPSPRGIKHVGIKELIGPKPIDILNNRIGKMFEGMGSASDLPSYEAVQPPEAPQGVGGPEGPVPAGESDIEMARRGAPGEPPSIPKVEPKASTNRTNPVIRAPIEAAERAADAKVAQQVKPPASPVANGQITPEHVAAENAFYTQARAELGADANPSAVLARAQALKVEHGAKGAPPPTTPVPPTVRPTLTQKMAAQTPQLRRVQPPVKASGGLSSASAQSQASLIMLQAKQGLISPSEADSKIQRLVGSGGRKTIRRPAAPE